MTGIGRSHHSVQGSLLATGGLRPRERGYRGQAVYSPAFLARASDPIVFRLTNRLLWRIPTRRIFDLNDEHVSDIHLDVGPGTGYFLDHCSFPSASPEITLLHVNSNVFNAASRRLARYRPTTPSRPAPPP